MQIIMPEEVRSILTALTSAGYPAYIVGGCVRDRLMGKEPQDWDIATSALPDKIKDIFPYTIDTGIKHGTVTVVIEGMGYEVTTFRIDGAYLDARRPMGVTFTSDIEEDLSRRDFTVNAMAYNPSAGLVDPFGGAEDIRKKNIRCVGCAANRFNEDALRMMRAIRFSAQLSFSIDLDTYSAISLLAGRLGLISMERIREELTKILLSPNPQAVSMLEEVKLWPHVLRGKSFKGDLTTPYLNKCPKEPAMLYALLLAEEEFMRHLKFDNRTIKETALYTKWLHKHIINDRYTVKTVLNIMGPGQLKNLIKLKKIITPKESVHWDAVSALCCDIIKSGECYTLKDLAVNGRDLIAAGIPPGKNMGRIMADLLDKVMADPKFNQKDALLNEVMR